MKKRILTFVLALVMVCSLLPVTAVAADTLTVTFDANGGSGTMASQVITNLFGELKPNEFTREYYAFNKWNTAPDGSGTSLYGGGMVDQIWTNGSITLYAQWKPFLYVGGVEVTSANADDVLGDGKVSYDVNTNTLMLNGATITGDANASYDEGILAFADLTIELTGVNEVTSSSRAIFIDGGSLTIEGSGTLTVTSPGYCIQAYGGDIAISDVTVSATGSGNNNRGIVAFQNGDAGGDITITDSTVKAMGETYGICASNSITISGSTVTADATTTTSGRTTYAISTDNSSITISDSTVTATAASPSHSYGIHYFTVNNSTLSITDSTVTAKGGTEALSNAPTLGGTWYQWTTTEGGPMTKSTDTPYAYEESHTYFKIEPIPVAPVTIPVTGVTLDATELELSVDGSGTLVATVSPENATNQNVTWSSSDESVATVVDGVVTAVAAGTATITVTTEDGGYDATCAVTVTATATDSDIPNPNPNPDDPNPDDPNPSPKPTYPIKKADTNKGSFSVNPTVAAKGETVIITVNPDDGYEVRNLTIIDANGKAIMFKPLENNQFSFEMPAGEVTVSVTFTESGDNGGTVVTPTFPNRYYPTSDEEQVETVTTPKTFDGGIALYVGVTALCTMGGAWLAKKKD